jgi:hypothetical protein
MDDTGENYSHGVKETCQFHGECCGGMVFRLPEAAWARASAAKKASLKAYVRSKYATGVSASTSVGKEVLFDRLVQEH